LQRSTLAKRAWLLFFLAAFLLYLYGTGRVPLIGPDEPRYAQIAREMLLHGDPVTPTLGGHPWFEKPALLYWMMMATFRLFGVSEWAARLGPGLSGLLTGLFVYLTGRRVERMPESPEEASGLGLWSGVALLSSAGMIVFARGASFDVVVTMTVTAALASFMMAELEMVERKRKLWMSAFYAGVGASLLAKGLIGIVIPAGVVAGYYLVRREWPAKSILKSLLWGVPLALIVAATWYGPVTLRHGWTFIDQFIIQHHFARYLSNKYHHPQPFYFYLPVLALLALPWTPLLVAALWSARRWAWRATGAMDRLRVFAFVWLVVPVAFFSLSGSKLPGYILPALPGAALLVGDRLRSFVRGGAGAGLRAMRVTGVVLLLLAAAIVAFYLATMGQWVWPRALAIAAPFLLAGLFVLARARERVWSAALIVCATFAATVLTINLVLDDGARRESVRDLLVQASARGYAAAPVLELHTVERTAEFYAAGRVARGGPDNDIIKFEGVPEIAEAARERGGTALVIVPLEYTSQLINYAPLESELIGDNGEVALVVVRVRG
jgi:4-amino-4-deoxy-L-arabinose transferase-like glycosyltransferase